MHGIARVHQEQSWLHLFSLPAFHRDLAGPRYDEPRVVRRRMQVYLLSLAGRQRDDHRAKLVTDVHPARAMLFRTNDDVIGDPKDALSRICLRPIGVTSGDDLHLHLDVLFGPHAKISQNSRFRPNRVNQTELKSLIPAPLSMPHKPSWQFR